MVRWNLIIAGGLLLLAGCGQSGPETPAERAHHALNKGDYQGAIAICDEAIAINPEDAEAYVFRGRAHHFRNQPGDLDLAVKDFSEAIRLAPKKSDAYLARSLAYRDQGDAEKSAEDDQKARELDESLKEVYAAMPEAPQSKLARVKSEEEPGEKPVTEALPSAPIIPTEPAQPPVEDSSDYLLRRPNFGTTSPSTGAGGAVEADAETQRSTRQREQLLRKPTFRLPTATRPAASEPVAEPEEEAAPGPPRTGVGGSLPQGRAPAGGVSGGPRGAAPARGARPADDGWGSEPGPISPWANRSTQGIGMSPSGRPPVQSPFAPRLNSPFPQAPPRPTGLVETPQNPFAPAGPAARTPPTNTAPPVPQVNIPGLRDDF